MGESLQHRRLRAPAVSGETLIDPPASCVGDLLTANAALAAQHTYDLQGRSLADAAADARAQLVRESFEYSRAYRDVERPQLAPDTPILLAGHQPQLFHPGVWFKNFALSDFARQHAGIGVNLTIDSDTIKSASIRVPGGTAANPTVELAPLDERSPEIPYEERSILDRARLASFGGRAAEIMRQLVPDPLLHEFWPRVVARSRQCDNLGECIAQARHQQEGQWGAATLELPQSRVCGFDAFHWFTAHLLAHLPRLWDAYNSAVAEYRRANHVRSKAHPVPDLAIDADWLEAPLWIWHRDDPRRRPVFVRQRGDDLVLSDRGRIELELPLNPEGDAGRAVERLAALPAQGIKLRTRALVTTMFARLCLSDLFLHGLGGAKYDQVTDSLIARFFGFQPPAYMTLTATLRLPVEHPPAASQNLRQVEQRLRELEFHPERYLANPDGAAGELILQKRHWVAAADGADARTRCRAIRRVNEALRSRLTDQTSQLLADRQRSLDTLQAEAILSSRECAFCLYPERTLRPLMQSLGSASDSE